LDATRRNVRIEDALEGAMADGNMLLMMRGEARPGLPGKMSLTTVLNVARVDGSDDEY
jgi:hypothetical protein